MASSTLITSYLMRGLASAKPSSLSISPGATALYFATDTSACYIWSGSSWSLL